LRGSATPRSTLGQGTRTVDKRQMRSMRVHAGRCCAAGPRREVLLLCQTPPPVHGVTMVNQQVLDALSRQGNSNIVRLPVGSAPTIDDIGRPNLAKFIDLGATVLALLRRCRNEPAAVAYLSFSPTGSASLRDAFVAAASRLAARRVLLHIHGEGFGELTRGGSARARLLRALLRGCEVVAITQSTADAATRSGLFGRVWQIPNGVPDPGPVTARSRDALLEIAYMANMQPAKGIDLLLGALRRLADIPIAFRARLIGDGTALLTLAEVRRKITELGLARQVTLHGPLYGDEKYRALARSHLFVYPSRHDHAPLVLLEAMALGLVPIVLDSGGVAEIVGPELADNVMAKAAPDASLELLLMQRMAYYHRHRDRLARDGDVARRRYLAQYTVEHFSDRVVALFAGDGNLAATA
jgi:glycosyltransferase involved in cell wall biosynthesis